MSTLEKLFVQIFDRKKWIVDQLNQQKDLYDQYLASTLLINGIRPPPWLWNAGFEAGSSDLKGSKKEELIAGLLFPPPRFNVPSSSIECNTFYNRQINAANIGQVSDHFLSETCASNKYFDVPKCPPYDTNLEQGFTPNGVPELDPLDSRMSETVEPVQSLARIQRSKSRQRALELRKSATEKSKKRPRKESCNAAYKGKLTRSRTSSEQPHHVRELLGQDKASDIPNEVCSRDLLSSSATQKFSSADKPVELQKLNCIETDVDLHNDLDTQVTVERSCSGQNNENHPTNDHSGITVRSETTRPEINCSEGFVRLDNSSNLFAGRVTRSRSASINKDQHVNPFNQMKESDTRVLLREESSADGIAGIELVSDAPVDRHSICSTSKQELFSMGVGLKFLPPSDGKIYVEPKQLIFDDFEDSRLNENVVLSLPYEMQDQSPEMMRASSNSIGSLKEVPISSNPQTSDPVELMESDNQMLVNQESSAAGIAGIKLVSADQHFVCSEQEGAGMRVNFEFSEPWIPSDGKTFADPKEKEDVEDCRSNECVGQSLEKERQDRSPEMSNCLESIISVTEVPISSILKEKCVASVDEQLLEKDQAIEVVNKEENSKARPTHAEENIENLERAQSICDEGAVADISQEGNKISMEVSIESLKKENIREKCSFHPNEYLLKKDHSMEVVDTEEELKFCSAELVKKVSMPSNIREKRSSYPDEYVLMKDHIIEVVDMEEELKAYSGSHVEERLEFDGMDTAECESLHRTPLTSKPSIVASPSPTEGPFQTSDVIVSNQAPVESEKGVTINNCIHERRSSSFDAESLERDGEEDSIIFPNASSDLESFEMKKIGGHIYPSPNTGRTSNVSPLSPRKETPDADHEYFIADTSPDSDKVINQVSSTSYHINGRKDSSRMKLTGEFDLASTSIFPEDGKLDLDVHDGPEESLTQLKKPDMSEAPEHPVSNNMLLENGVVDLDTCNVPEESLVQLKKPDMLLEAPETRCYAFATNSGKSSILRHMVTTEGISQIHNAGQALCLANPTSHGDSICCHKSNESLSTKIDIQSEKTIIEAWRNSWPPRKRRKIVGQSGKGFGTSSRLRRVKPHQPEDETCRNLKSAEAGLGIDQDFQSIFFDSPAEGMSQSTKRPSIESLQYPAMSQTIEGELGRKLVNEDAKIQLGSEQTHVEFLRGSCGNKQNNSHSCLKDVVGSVDPVSVSFHEKSLYNSHDEQNLGGVGHMGSVERDGQEKISNLGEQLLSHYNDLNLIDADQTMPELEGFSYSPPPEFIMPWIGLDTVKVDELDLPSATIDRISVLEQLCRSSSMATPLPQVSEYKQKDQNTQSSCNPSTPCFRSFSDCLPSSSFQSDCDGWSPYTPPVEKFSHNIISLSADQGSKKHRSTSPELTPIHEDSTSSNEENGSLRKVVDQFQEGPSTIKKSSSTCREPLADISNIKPKVNERGSLVDSANEDLNFHGSQIDAKKTSRDGYGTDRRYKNKDKENQSSASLAGNGIGTIKSSQSKYSKLKSSINRTGEKVSHTFRKGGNIVSDGNVKSFLSCVQPKQSSPGNPLGKTRGPVRVKALKAAQALKLKEEKKKNDREMRKEAQKARKMEEEAKKKEEEAKEKEASKAERKRLREVEEKNQEIKRMCIEEERRQQKEQKRKIHVKKGEKELHHRTADEKESKGKGFHGEEIKHQNPSKVKDRNESMKRKETQPKTTKVSASDAKKASNVREDCETLKESHDNEKVVRNFCEESEDVISVTGGTQEQAYDISPYKASDDEEDEDNPTGKAFPSWSREKCVAPLLCGLQQLDLHEIFHPSSFCSITEVLLPRKNPKKLQF